MASCSGASSGSSTLQNSGSEGDQKHVMDQRKRKRMVSNRESARRSRIRKQNHLDDLISQVGQLKKENNEILSSMGITTQLCLSIEAENSILGAQMAELNNRLQSLNEIIDYINSSNYLLDETEGTQICEDGFMNPWDNLYMNQPIMASAEMFMC
ncbi:BZIP transcription factor [Quillaja saponaria]|uniref:BZIP transcription factor n=1 Tax=Quillaja saponaria TaxID=32244 RepID=A0AAD7LC64_QUISA|nr:BZIP transcription factor [Quillaja saponaria]